MLSVVHRPLSRQRHDIRPPSRGADRPSDQRRERTARATNLRNEEKHPTKRLLVTLLALGLIASVAFAHNGMIHAMGTVTALSDSSITVETTEKKTVEVALTDVTTYENGSKQSTSKDLKMGDCVVIHAVR